MVASAQKRRIIEQKVNHLSLNCRSKQNLLGNIYHVVGFCEGLGMENIGGIFVVLVCGLLVAIFMAVLEFVWMLRHTPATEVREGYFTCLCFLSFSPPSRLPP